MRKCSNWIETFIDWIGPLSEEAPENYILWSGLFTLAAVTKRKIKVPQSYLGRWECYPHLYIMLVGPPGFRKTTCARSASELLDEISGIEQAPDVSSVAALLTDLVNSEDCALYIISEEFSDLFGKSSGKEIYEFLTSMYDGKKKFKASTHVRGAEFAEQPCLNMLAATTPKWISENMPEDIIGGGFASRVIFIYEDRLRGKRLFYDNVFDKEKYDKLKKMLIDDLKHIAGISGEFKFSDDAKKFLEEWYQDMKQPKNPKLTGYYHRKPAHVMKLSMLLHIAYSDELVIDVNDVELALKILDRTEINMGRVFEGIGKNPHFYTTKEIIQYLAANGKTERSKLLQEFEAVDYPYKLDEIINGLLEMKLIKVISENGKIYYEA